MSIILDALRGGRAKSQTGPSPNTVQTDAVLHTLGYGRFNPATPGNRLKRALGLVVLAVILGAGLWVAVIWLTRTPPQPVSTETRPPVAVSPDAPGAPAAPGTVAPSVSVGSAPVVSNTPVTPNAPVAAPSERADVPTAAPVAPSPAPTRPAGWVGPNASTVTAGEDHFGRARMYQRLGDFENALVGYRQVLLRDDLNVEAHNNLGVLYRDKGLFEDAIRHFERAIAINPGYARARNNLGVVYLGQRNFDLAATQFHAALAIDPKNLESMVNLSTVEREAGRRDHARAWLTRALDADGRNAEAHYNLGLMDDEAGARPQALGHYRAFLQYGAADHPALVGEVRKRIAELESKN